MDEESTSRSWPPISRESVSSGMKRVKAGDPYRQRAFHHRSELRGLGGSQLSDMP
jgi:hypothetical protein